MKADKRRARFTRPPGPHERAYADLSDWQTYASLQSIRDWRSRALLTHEQRQAVFSETPVIPRRALEEA